MQAPVRTTLAGLLALALAAAARGHGGTYRGPGGAGPGDTAPAASGGGTGTAPTGGGATAGGAAGGPGQSSGSGGNAGKLGPAQPSSAAGPSANSGPDGSRWQAWWGFNKDAYLDLKARVHFSDVLAGSDEAFLGRLRPLTRDELRPAPDAVFGKVVPALRELLAKERSNDILSGALIALAKAGDRPGESEVAGWITPFLGDPNQELAETAAVALGILGNEAEIELLRALFLGQSEALAARGVELRGPLTDRTRAFAAYGLGLVGQRSGSGPRERVVDTLVGWMARDGAAQSQSEIPVACVVALGLVALPSDPLALKPSGALTAPARVASLEEQVLWLSALLEQRAAPKLVRAHAPTAIARLLRSAPGGRNVVREAVVERLLLRLDRQFVEDIDVRTGCVIALGQIGDAGGEDLDARIRLRLMGARDALREQQLGHFAMMALAQCGARPGRGGAPFAALQGKEGNPRVWLAEQLQSGSSATRCYAALALGVLERGVAEARGAVSQDVLGALRAGLREARSPDEVGAFAVALGVARDAEARELLRGKLEGVSDAEARGYVAVALGLVGDSASIGRIEELVAGSRFQPELLRQAAIALGLLGDKHVVPQLFEMLERATSLSSQAAIASALGLIGDARSLDPLIAMLEDREERSDLARAFAAVALGMCADKESLPWNSNLATHSNYRANTATLYSPDTGTGILDIL